MEYKYNLVSFNISKNQELMNLSFDYLRNKKNTILFLQETDECKIPSDAVYYSPNATSPIAGMQIVASEDLGVSGCILPDSIIKCTNSALILPIGDVCLVNVHMPPRSARDNRDFYYLRVIDSIKEKIRSLSSRKIVIGGDFNENPFDRMMALNETWCAKRSLLEESASNGHIMSFYNPFWNYLKRPKRRKISGTIIAGGSYPMDMAIFDQFIVSTNVGLKDIKSFGILEKMCNVVLEQKNLGHNGFHWPVYLTIESKES